jgi:hypothetical protein
MIDQLAHFRISSMPLSTKAEVPGRVKGMYKKESDILLHCVMII